MSVEFDRVSPGKFDSRTLNRKTLDRWTGRTQEMTNNENSFENATDNPLDNSRANPLNK